MGMVHGPNMVSKSLVLALDAGNAQSYPGSGSTWFNLVGEQNTTLYQSPTFTTVDGIKCLDFDGVNQYASTGINLHTPISWSIWYRYMSSTTAWRILHVAAWNNTSNFWELLFRDPYTGNTIENWAFSYLNGSRHDYSWTYPYPASVEGEWRNVTNTYVGNLGKGYLNGVLQSPTDGDTFGFTDWNNASNYADFNIARANNYSSLGSNSWVHADCQVAIFKVWNKTLTDAEVLQNFNAHRSRFGL